MKPETHFGRMVYFARMGFNIVPSVQMHETKGPGLLYMDAKGLRFEPTNQEEEPLNLTWEEFDNGPR